MELRDTLDDGVTTALGTYASTHGLLPLRWHLCSSTEISLVGRAQLTGQASLADYPEQAVSTVIQARATVEGLDIAVWGIVDQDVFERGPSPEQT